ncbi:MAG: magnesium chelatase subunit H [Pseudomonadota bacterium]
MKPKHTSAADRPFHFVLVTLDNHVTGSVERAGLSLAKEAPELKVSVHAAADWGASRESLERCHADILSADVVLVTMLFMEEHINAVLPQLRARQPHCDAMVCCMCASEVMKLTRMGRFSMDKEASGPIALLKRLRGKSQAGKGSAGAQQLSVLKRIPRILRFIPGTAQDVRAYFLTMQYWLAGSEENIRRMIANLVTRYAREGALDHGDRLTQGNPIDYPETGLYDPDRKKPISETLPRSAKAKASSQGTVGVLVMRSYALADNTDHYDSVVRALRSRGLNVVTAFASGLDARPAVEKYFVRDGEPTIDLLLSLTGFSLVGGPAYNDAHAAEELLRTLDVPYLAAHALEFQSLEKWEDSVHGLMPVESTMMVAIPELDGATVPTVFGGRSERDGSANSPGGHTMRGHPERIDMLADRVTKIVSLRRAPKSERRVAAVIFNFPPHSGNTGTAANLAVFQSLFNTLHALHEDGYTVDLPKDVEELRDAVIGGNAEQYGAIANVFAKISADDHVTREPYLGEIEAQWGPVPGKQLTDGQSLFVLGAQFGNVFIGVQPGFGYEGDPMRLLFERGFAPTHAFSAFYRYLREDFAAHCVLHFGTHGALEFMPGKQSGMAGDCWPQRLIGDLPNFYLYSANNPSEGIIAKRRAGATLVSYLTPPVTRAELYQGLQELKGTVDRWRSRCDESTDARTELARLIQDQAAALDLCSDQPIWDADSESDVEKVRRDLLELEETLIPYGLHVVGQAPKPQEQRSLLKAIAQASFELSISESMLDALEVKDKALFDRCLREEHPNLPELESIGSTLFSAAQKLAVNQELAALLHAMDGGYIPPVAGGDLLRSTDILPTGRNVHGFDPYRLPSTFAMRDGRRQAETLLEKHKASGGALPETVALVLWGSDNLKNEGGPIAQAMALIGAEPRIDGYGRVCGAKLIPLLELGRPRIDVIMTLSGIFRDLLPLQTRMLAEASYLAASAEDEPLTKNFVRKHALEQQAKQGCDLATAALRVFSNAEGAYGSNVNLLIDSSRWEEEDELADTYTARKCFAYGLDGKPEAQSELLSSMLSTVDLAYQNLDSVEVGITSLDQYFDTLGGISRAVRRARDGADVPVYISDQTSGTGSVRTLDEQVALEARTRVLNPKWYESVLDYGFEGVRQIESHVTNTMGWSATTGQVSPWVYERMTDTFVLDEAMRDRLASLNPHSAVKVVNRLLEAHEREYWEPDPEKLEALQRASEDLEDWLEGVTGEVAA